MEMPFAGLALAKVPWSKWAKWILPLIGLQFIEANIGIRDGKIVYIGNETPEAAKVIDAKNKVVSPGFIDIHMHEENFAGEGKEYVIIMHFLRKSIHSI